MKTLLKLTYALLPFLSLSGLSACEMESMQKNMQTSGNASGAASNNNSGDPTDISGIADGTSSSSKNNNQGDPSAIHPAPPAAIVIHLPQNPSAPIGTTPIATPPNPVTPPVVVVNPPAPVPPPVRVTPPVVVNPPSPVTPPVVVNPPAPTPVVTRDTTPPVFAVTSPAIRFNSITGTNSAAAVYSGAQYVAPTRGLSEIQVSGTFSDASGIASLSCTHNAGTCTVTGLESWSVTIPKPNYTESITLHLWGKDKAGNMADAYISIGLPASIKPVLTISSPTAAQQFPLPKTILVSGIVTSPAGGIASVTVNGVAASISDRNIVMPNWSHNWSASLALVAGSNTINVVAKDDAATPNESSQSLSVSVASVVDPSGAAVVDAANVIVLLEPPYAKGNGHINPQDAIDAKASGTRDPQVGGSIGDGSQDGVKQKLYKDTLNTVLTVFNQQIKNNYPNKNVKVFYMTAGAGVQGSQPGEIEVNLPGGVYQGASFYDALSNDDIQIGTLGSFELQYSYSAACKDITEHVYDSCATQTETASGDIVCHAGYVESYMGQYCGPATGAQNFADSDLFLGLAKSNFKQATFSAFNPFPGSFLRPATSFKASDLLYANELIGAASFAGSRKAASKPTWADALIPNVPTHIVSYSFGDLSLAGPGPRGMNTAGTSAVPADPKAIIEMYQEIFGAKVTYHSLVGITAAEKPLAVGTGHMALSTATRGLIGSSADAAHYNQFFCKLSNLLPDAKQSPCP